MSQRKQITIPQTGPIWTKGGIMGPIITPYHEDVDTIRLMLSNGVKLNEVLEDGTQQPLTLESLAKLQAPEVVKAAEVIEKVENKEPEVTTPDADKEPEATTPAEPQKEQQHQQQGKKEKGNKNFNNQNNNRVQDPVVKK